MTLNIDAVRRAQKNCAERNYSAARGKESSVDPFAQQGFVHSFIQRRSSKHCTRGTGYKKPAGLGPPRGAHRRAGKALRPSCSVRSAGNGRVPPGTQGGETPGALKP